LNCARLCSSLIAVPGSLTQDRYRASLQPLESIDDCARGGRVTRLGQLILQNSAFGPEDIERLSAAYEEALRLLQLSDRTDAATQIIARRIIQAAQSGVREPSEICRLAIKDLRVA
jgi:integrase